MTLYCVKCQNVEMCAKCCELSERILNRGHFLSFRISERMTCEESAIFSQLLHIYPMLEIITQPLQQESLSAGKLDHVLLSNNTGL